MVILLPVVVERTNKITCDGYGTYSYCHPERGFSPNWFAVMAVLNVNCGISAPSTVPYPLVRAFLRRGRGSDAFRPRCSKANCTSTRAPGDPYQARRCIYERERVCYLR